MNACDMTRVRTERSMVKNLVKPGSQLPVHAGGNAAPAELASVVRDETVRPNWRGAT